MYRVLDETELAACCGGDDWDDASVEASDAAKRYDACLSKYEGDYADRWGRNAGPIGSAAGNVYGFFAGLNGCPFD
jgi:hypothetical protein